MNPIFAYAAEYQYREIQAGRIPRTIRLTKEQMEFCRNWLKENNIPLYISKGEGVQEKLNATIMGMEVIEV